MVILTCEQCQQILTFELYFGNLQFLRIEAAGFSKNRGIATSVDVMLVHMVRCPLHIPSAQNRGEVLQ